MSGKFIVFEGGEGSGKDTLIDLVKKNYADRDIVYVRDPGGSPRAEEIRELVLGEKSKDISKPTELLLFLAARSDAVANVIRPALDAGKTVVANRFTLSTIAYQVYGREQLGLLDFIKNASHVADQGLVPDLCILLDIDPKIGIERTTTRKNSSNRFEEEALAFHNRVREGYKKHLGESARETLLIDSSGTIEDAWKKADEALQSLF